MDSQLKDRTKTTPAIVCLKILLHIFNLIYLIIGIAILSIGIWTKVQLHSYMELSGLYYDNTAYVLIGVGTLILLVAIGGFYCTAKDKIAMLYLYAVFIGFITFLELAAGIAAASFWQKIDSTFTKGLIDNLKPSKQWDNVQKTLHCCGVDSPSDWTKKDFLIPTSCYKNGNPNNSTPITTAVAPTTTPPITAQPAASTTKSAATTPTVAPAATTPTVAPAATMPTVAPAATTPTVTPAATTPTVAPAATTPTNVSAGRKRRSAADDNESEGNLFPNGCHSKIKAELKEYMYAIIGSAFGFLLVQVCGVILACCLARKTKKNNYEQIY